MKKLLMVLVLMTLLLTACEQKYKCNSAEARSSCEKHLAGTVTAAEFDVLYSDCNLQGRYTLQAQRVIFTSACLASRLAIPEDVFTGCFGDGAHQSYNAGRGAYQDAMIGLILCANGLDYTNRSSVDYAN